MFYKKRLFLLSSKSLILLCLPKESSVAGLT